MVTLLSVSGPSRKTLYPLSILALVDPQAKWARRWLHGGLGRKLFLRFVKHTL